MPRAEAQTAVDVGGVGGEGTDDGDGDGSTDLAEGVEDGVGRAHGRRGDPSRTTPVTDGIARDLPAPTGMMQRAVTSGWPRGVVTPRATRPTAIDASPTTTGTRAPYRFVTGPLTRLPAMAKNAEGRKTRPHSGERAPGAAGGRC